MMAQEADRTIYDAGWQGTKVRWVARIFIPLGVPMMLGAIWALFDLRAVDGSLEPIGARIAIAALLFVTGFLCTVGMWIYLSIYPMRLQTSGDTIIMETARLIGSGRTILPISHFGSKTFHTGRIGAPGSLERRAGFRFDINTPFSTIAIAGWRLPMLIDHQGGGFDSGELRRLTSAAERARRNAQASASASDGKRSRRGRA
ncbi:MAG: hypothetical protein KDJ36_07140 [Hyphomicrobiaceae bacterium]|nr:hypothetical protein [Hyphomicrobiaceae bacterium]